MIKNSVDCKINIINRYQKPMATPLAEDREVGPASMKLTDQKNKSRLVTNCNHNLFHVII